ncbi:MAG: hypothetical protein MHM6MM_004252 [Cercozoa sp. M6MM]
MYIPSFGDANSAKVQSAGGFGAPAGAAGAAGGRDAPDMLGGQQKKERSVFEQMTFNMGAGFLMGFPIGAVYAYYGPGIKRARRFRTKPHLAHAQRFRQVCTAPGGVANAFAIWAMWYSVINGYAYKLTDEVVGTSALSAGAATFIYSSLSVPRHLKRGGAPLAFRKVGVPTLLATFGMGTLHLLNTGVLRPRYGIDVTRISLGDVLSLQPISFPTWSGMKDSVSSLLTPLQRLADFARSAGSGSLNPFDSNSDSGSGYGGFGSGSSSGYNQHGYDDDEDY